MKRWSLTVWNDWRYVARGMVDVTVLRFNVDYLRSNYASVDVVVLGFGISLTRYADPSLTKWTAVELGEFVSKPAPVESLGREHA